MYLLLIFLSSGSFIIGYLIILLKRLQEPSEEAFDIFSVPKEVKSQPLAEKKAPGKKPTGLGAPPVGPTSTVDSYERLLSSIPEFASYGKLFKVPHCFFLSFIF